MTNMFTSTIEPNLDAVAEKYKNDPAEMLKALAHKEAHIQRLEAEAKERAAGITLAEAMEQLKLQQSANPPQSQAPTSAPVQSVLDDTSLEQKLDKFLGEKAEKERRERAKAEVSSTLLRQYGTQDKAIEAMNAKASELGMTVQALDAIALNSPQALFKLFGIENSQRPVNGAPTMGNIRTNMTETPNVDPMQEFRDVLKTDRNKAMSQEVQNAIMAKAMAAAGIKR
jgi:hypothetical protein